MEHFLILPCSIEYSQSNINTWIFGLVLYYFLITNYEQELEASYQFDHENPFKILIFLLIYLIFRQRWSTDFAEAPFYFE